jgi:hypothetical protein
MLRTTDFLLGPPRLTDAHIASLFARIDQPDAKDRQFVDRLRYWCRVAGVDDANALSQMIWETDDMKAPRWNRDLNPAGIGITGDATIQPFRITNADEAARVMVQAIYAMPSKQWHPAVPMPEGAVSWMNGVWLPKVRHPRYPATVTQVQHQHIQYQIPGEPFTRATWAADDAYMGHVTRFNAYVPGVPDQSSITPTPEKPPMADLIFGRVPHPPFVDLIVDNRFWQDLGPRRAVGVCQHSMVGTLRGSYTYILPGGGGQALWDYSVGGATDGANDGVIWRHNDPKGRRAGWANGGSDGLEGDGPLFVRTLGIDAINRDLVSIERSDGGNYQSQPMSPKQFESIAQLTAYWFDQARVPWNTYPVNPNVGCVTHMIHKEFATKDCPFPPVYNEISRLQDRVRAILKAAQTVAPDAGNELPPEQPIEQDHDRYPNGWTAAALKDQWGVLPRVNPGGSVTSLHFAVTKNPIAAIANAWIARGAADGITTISDLPKPQLWQVIAVDEDTKSDLITFEGGREAWQLWRPNKWVPWTWTDERALKAKAAG